MLVILLAGCGSRGFLLLSAQASIAGDKHCGFINFPFQMGVICMWSVTLKKIKGRVCTEKEVLTTGHLLPSLLPHPPIPSPQVFLPVAVTLSSFSCGSPGHSVHRQAYIFTRTPFLKYLIGTWSSPFLFPRNHILEVHCHSIRFYLILFNGA